MFNNLDNIIPLIITFEFEKQITETVLPVNKSRKKLFKKL